MDIRGWFLTQPPARWVHMAGIALVAAGALYWGLRFWQLPASSTTDMATPTSDANPTALAVARWLGPGDVRLNVVVQGVMTRHDRAVALLSINDAAPQTFMVGETLMENVKVKSIDASGVVLESAGKPLHIASPISAQFPPEGIVRHP